MLAMPTKPNNSGMRQIASPIRWLAAAIFFWSLSHATAAAQIHSAQARVTRAAPGAVLYGGGVSPSALRQGDTLQPGDVIDTRGSGRVVIALSDGSQVVIFPGSRVELKNFQAGASWRDLLRVTIGRVRATINHHGKRPNPYRVYSPIASIAVRGTDFLVIVEPSGETRVLVYEGLVEVGSLVNPQKTVLVRTGRSIVVRPSGDISLVMVAPRGGLGEVRGLRLGGDQETNLLDDYNSQRSSRFTAFNDSHLDSLQNPAYATEFGRPSGRFYLAPSFSPKVEYASSFSNPNYILSPQASFFTPLGSRGVVGAGVSVTTTETGGASTANYFDGLTQADVYNRYERNAKFTTTSLSLIAARRFGQAGRTSFGAKFDYLIGRISSSFNRDTSESRNFDPAFEEGKAHSRRAGLTVGVTQDIGGGKKLGVYYRYSMGSIENSYRSSGQWGFLNDDPHYYPGGAVFRTQPGHSSKAGVLFRGSVARRLFYGVESSILFEQYQVEDHRPLPTTIGDVTYTPTQIYLENHRVRRGMIGVGIGYALFSRAVLSLDLSMGRARENSLGRSHFSSVPPGIRYGAPDYQAHERAYFRAWHIGGQTDVWRNLFAGASLFGIRAGKRSSHEFPQESYVEYKLLNLSAGWRLTPNWTAQYVYFTSYGNTRPSHTLLLRYEFGRREEK